VGSSRVVLAGDSAGGGLSVAAMVANKDVLPAGAALLCPWVDLAARGGSLEENARYDWAEPEYFQRWATEYLRGEDERDPRASPIYADLRGLPPLLIQVGGAEMLRDQAVAFAARARDAEVPVLLEVWPDMVHDWHVLASMFSVSRRAIDRIGAFVRERTTGS
jgi:acetyl esterase/lipase